jgi:hypothetical protein
MADTRYSPPSFTVKRFTWTGRDVHTMFLGPALGGLSVCRKGTQWEISAPRLNVSCISDAKTLAEAKAKAVSAAVHALEEMSADVARALDHLRRT